MTKLKLLQLTIPEALVLTAFMSNQASAAPSTCTNTYVLTAATSYSASFDVNAGTFNPDTGTGNYNCVQQQDKIFSDFNLGQIPSPGSAVLSFATIDGVDTHSITYDGNYLKAGSPYTFSFNLAIEQAANPLPTLTGSSSDLIQSSGTATLAETLVSNLGTTYHIDFTKTGTNYAGPTATNPHPTVATGLNPGTEWLDVTDVLTLGPNGSNVSGVENAFTENVPEPVSALLLGSGIVGLWFMRRFKKAA